jgi:hypothetical protein
MERSVQIVRLELEGPWSAYEFGQTLLSISDLYNLRLFLEILREDQRDWESFCEEIMHFPPFRHRWRKRLPYWSSIPWTPGFSAAPLPVLDDAQLSRLWKLLDPEERLEVRRINYGSPGVADLAGIGTVIGHIKDFIVKLIERGDSRKQRELNEERAALENDRIRLENARSFVALARDLGYTESEVRRLVAHVDEKQGIFLRLIDQKKLRGVLSPANTSEEQR